MKFPHTFVAGTFDGLHKGHRVFLSEAFRQGKRVTIGLTSDKFVKKFKIFNLKFSKRKKQLELWLKIKKFDKRSTIIPIDDPHEPAASFSQAGALLVTADNKKRGEEINALRQKRNLPALTLVEVPLVMGEDQQPISSTRVRNGEIDAEGRLILPDRLRPELQQPMGLVLSGNGIADSFTRHANDALITVGDVATKTVLDAGLMPALIIIDNKVGRKPFFGLRKYQSLFTHSKKVKSGPGYISKSAMSAIRKSKVIEVDGEEDLLALPAIAYAREGSVLYYGQPALAVFGCGPIVSGLVEVVVTDQKKKEAIALLGQFIQ